MLVLMGGLILFLGSRLPWMSVPVLYGAEGHGNEAIEIGSWRFAGLGWWIIQDIGRSGETGHNITFQSVVD
jgi:hypothetical protein